MSISVGKTALKASVSVELEHIDVEDGEIFGLELVLLGHEQIVFAGAQLDDVLEAQPELLAQQVVAGLGALAAGFGCLVLALVG